MSNVAKKVLKQKPLTDEQIERLENYPQAQRIDLAALIAQRRQQTDEKPSSPKINASLRNISTFSNQRLVMKSWNGWKPSPRTTDGEFEALLEQEVVMAVY